MRLDEMLTGVSHSVMKGRPDVPVVGLCHDSAKAGRGYVFVAIRGERTDGHLYAADAVARGAAALVVERPLEELDPSVRASGTTVVRVEDGREALAVMASNLHGAPAMGMEVVAVTGTNGKTSVTYLLRSIWESAGLRAGVMGTIEAAWLGSRRPASLTTPEADETMEVLALMAADGVEAVALEASSHALEKKRLWALDVDAAVFTNLSRDHLDYHGTMERYFAAKARLFGDVLRRSRKPSKAAVVNIDDPYGRRLVTPHPTTGSVVTYALDDAGADVRCLERRVEAAGIKARVATPWGEVSVSSPLLGTHNLYNILAALAAAMALGVDADAVERGIAQCPPVRGRLERVPNGLGFEVVIDYAHTPDALRNVLGCLRPLTRGRLIVVFGCGGDRDREKRPLMGEIARRLADVVVATSDNPRTEDPEAILDEIERGILSAAPRGEGVYRRIADRESAIGEALRMAAPGDTVLIAGKGHEDYQIVGTERRPFDDRLVAEAHLDEIAAARGVGGGA